MKIGRNISMLRRTGTKYSQKEVADVLGIDRNTYASWEAEITDVKAEFIPKLAEIFRVSIADLFDPALSPTRSGCGETSSSIAAAIIFVEDRTVISTLIDLVASKSRAEQ